MITWMLDKKILIIKDIQYTPHKVLAEIVLDESEQKRLFLLLKDKFGKDYKTEEK
jgi:hypothetical protein